MQLGVLTIKLGQSYKVLERLFYDYCVCLCIYFITSSTTFISLPQVFVQSTILTKAINQLSLLWIAGVVTGFNHM